MQSSELRATRIELLRVDTAPMRTFHLTWMAFFLCFFAWFGIAPLMPLVREELGLTKEQIGNTVIASVAITVLARLVVGRLCDTLGPRRTYSGLLLLGAIPVMAIGLCRSYETFLIARLAIGAIGASFVITQYHTSVMFAPNIVGTANATTAGWGNLGGGVTQLAMPLLVTALVHAGLHETLGWRVAMVVPGVLMIVMAGLYYRYTRDTPEGDLRDLPKPPAASGAKQPGGTFALAARDPRVWALAAMYGACFGVELTINNIAALYFHDQFGLGLSAAGVIAGLHGLMNVFARSLGGFCGDRVGTRFGIGGRVGLLGAVLLIEGIALVAFARTTALAPAIALFVFFSLFVEMGCGATYAVVPFVNRRALGSVSGIVGAGGNLGAVLAGFLFRAEGVAAADALLYLGIAVIAVSTTALLVPFARAEPQSAPDPVTLPAGVLPQPGAVGE
jgi:MFS transporter, NNP family, nitrate/nitrite transporter